MPLRASLASFLVVAALVAPSRAHAACTKGLTRNQEVMGCVQVQVCNGTTWEYADCLGGAPCTSGCSGAAGTNVCDPDTCEMTTATCKVAETETCNGCDDNADGARDNAPGSGQEFTLAQVCTNTCDGRRGLQVCQAPGTYGACNTGAEVCDGCDNDGNGAVDNAPNSTQANTLTRTCSNGCSGAGSQTCSAGQYSACTGCSGTRACTTLCGATSSVACTASCQPEEGAVCKAPEVCNNCDDDGDGEVDENLDCQTCAR